MLAGEDLLLFRANFPKIGLIESRTSALIHLVSLLLEYAVAQGLDANALLEAAGLDADLIANREARVPFEQYQALWLGTAGKSSDPDFKLHFGEAARHFPPGHLLGR